MLKKVIDISNYLFGGLFNIGLAIALIVVAWFVTEWAFNQGQNFLAEDYTITAEAREVVVEIPEDAGRREIAQILYENDLIGNWMMFYFESFFNGSANHFRHGTFSLNTAMPNSYLMFALSSLEYLHVEEGQLLIIEGLTNWQLAELAATMGYFTATDFLYELENGIYLNDFLLDVTERENRLQGFLFPATYNLPQNPTPRDLVFRMLDAFEGVFTQEMWGRFNTMHFQLGWQPTLEQLITIASIIEAETTIDNVGERPLVASVIFNRLEEGMPLEMISTVVYATNTRWDMLTPASFQHPSPYNTFNRTGLPAGPINNPGLNSIESALSPANTDYLFMASRNDGTGGHFFTASHEDYLAFIAQRDAAPEPDEEGEEI
ncbi:MAG: endolytic transglycosylase MltG [Defluviitaleaceae bacterium]|nr:endolytic transglycosylase MltG [Defluviitaleaceae bacterium]